VHVLPHIKAVAAALQGKKEMELTTQLTQNKKQ
jgi:hypothetical protein